MIETFELSDLTQEFFDKLCYVEQMYSTGLGGDGHILMVTEDGCEYLIGIEGYDEYNPQNTVPLLATYETWDEEKQRRVYCIENNAWTYVEYSDVETKILVRNDIYEKMNKLHDDLEHRKLGCWDFYKCFECALKPKRGLQRKTYIKTKETWDKIITQMNREP